ncbi:hypothetical protein Tco_1302308 [Tanacetum coccineum]
MVEPILSDNLEKAPTESNLSITSNDINIELSKEFLVELRKNKYHGTYNEDVADHIVKVLKMVDLIYVPDVDSHQLRMKVFPLSLADDAKECILSSNELKESKYENPSNTATDSFFKAYELPNKRRCKAEKFEAIQYSLGPNEEYIAIRSYEYDIWEGNEDNMSKIYQDIFHKKDEGWKTKELSKKLSGIIMIVKMVKLHRDLKYRSYALSWKPCQGDSLNLPDHRIHKDGDGDALFQLKSDSLPHAHAQTTKTYYKHRDSRIMKAQELKTKTSAQTLIYKIFLQRYQVYQGRLLASFQDDAKYEHVGQDTRSQGGKDDQDGRIKI